MAATHQYEAQARWQKGAGTNPMNHRLEFRDRPAIEASGAPQYKGDATMLNPEELFLASLASCQMLTYVALAARAGIDVIAYEDRPEATLTMADRRMRITEVVLRPSITLAAGSDEAKARAMVESAHQGCFIANSVACAVHAEAEFLYEG